VNFYKHYIGDFQRDTGHLSLTQRGAYLCLMHHYYATEKPLPNDHAALCRIAGAIDKAEREAVKAAMAFFLPCESGLMHLRIEAELHKAGTQADTNRRIAHEREEARRAAREAERLANEASTNRATNREPSQTPDTRHHVPNGTERARKRAARQCPADFAVTPDLLAWAAAEVPSVPLEQETAKFRDYTFKTALTDWPGAWRNWMRKALEYTPRVNGPQAESFAQRAARARVESIAPGVAARPTQPATEIFDVTARLVG
jgi:uncharacterized protein YdaU (DUF1376 family)